MIEVLVVDASDTHALLAALETIHVADLSSNKHRLLHTRTHSCLSSGTWTQVKGMIIDTGVRFAHTELGSQIDQGASRTFIPEYVVRWATLLPLYVGLVVICSQIG